MPQFLFIFGFESPEERRCNQVNGTDFESSVALWIDSDSKRQP
jgi:hypothetical protein